MMRTLLLGMLLIGAASCTQTQSVSDDGNSLPRSTPAKENVDQQSIDQYWEAVKSEGQDIHSMMLLRHGKVVEERWLGEHSPEELHQMHSVSKTFTATAIGFAVSEGKLKVTDKVISFFPDELPATVNDNLQALEIRHLLTMTTGQDVSPNVDRSDPNKNWVEGFFETPFVHNPGNYYLYNSMATYMLSAIVQKVTGEKVFDYLTPRLFEPLGIKDITWEESPQGITCGGWGLKLRTEDMAKMGQFMLQRGMWKGQQLIPAAWIDEATSWKVRSLPSGTRPEDVTMDTKGIEWMQGYCYQMWRGRHNTVRADGFAGQYIILVPDRDAVIITTAGIEDTQAQLDLIWKYLYSALR